MTTFVLVHGAFGTPAELAPVIPYIEAAGHEAIAVDLQCDDPHATLADYADIAAAGVESVDGPVVVVGHSAGGATISLLPERVEVDRLVYVAAVVPQPGKSILQALGDEVMNAVLDVTVDNGDGTRAFDIDKLAAGAPPEERAALLEYLRATQRAQGWAVMHEPWPGDSLPGGVPCSYILTLEDTLLPPELQRAMAADLGVDPSEIASDHEVFGTNPGELAAILVRLAASD
jgi:pimeloyl-ACP methyl ester carboxylesterase